jgi:hypothetical protein
MEQTNSMNPANSPALSGRVASLHLHPIEPGAPLQSVEEIELIEGKGIFGEPRYFGRISRNTGLASRRQVTLIERELIAEHAVALMVPSIPPGAVRSNIETLEINLIAWVGREVEIGEAILRLYAARDPCAKMDAVCQGLRELMANHRQGVLAQILRSGRVRVGDEITVRPITGSSSTA